MVRLTPPYFFPEFLKPQGKASPTARERTLGLTAKDLDWLYNLYLATDESRQDTRRHDHPMRVEKVLINVSGKPPIPLAGAFAISPTPDNAKALLYTPDYGIQVYDSHAELLSELTEQLEDPQHSAPMLNYLSMDQRNALGADTPMVLTTQIIEGDVMPEQARMLQACQLDNVKAMLGHLQKTPTLPDMLDTLLSVMARPHFKHLDQRHTRVNVFTRETEQATPRWVNSLTLSEALLQFYVRHGWPKGQTREYSNPKHHTTDLTPSEREEDHQRWEALVEQSSSTFSKLLESLLQTYWNEDVDSGTSRVDFFAQVMAQKFRLDVLLKRQSDIITADESHALQALFLSDQSARSAHAENLTVEKVRLYAPHQHYVEPASTLMITERHAYLYTQSRGLQVLENLDDLKDRLLSMLKAEGHEDEWLNVLSLDERDTLLGLDPISIAARPIPGNVFVTLVQDILRKQTDNLNHALEIYRRSDGQVDLAALLDSALDVRALLDNQLATLETAGRWTLHPVTRGDGRPSTVKAERARLQLQSLQAVERALALERANHPTLRSIIADTLNAELKLQQQAVKASEVYINTYATRAQEREERTPVQSLSMLEHFIERLAREAPAVPFSSRTTFYTKGEGNVFVQLPSMTLKTFNTVIERVLLLFSKHAMRQQPHDFLVKTHAQHAHSMLVGLRSEAELRWLDKTLAPTSQAILDTLLQPESLSRLTRHGLNGFLPDAYGLTLDFNAVDTPQPLANIFVITERGGIDPQRSGQALLWTPRLGYEVFASVNALRDEIALRLVHPLNRLSLLENLPFCLREPHQAFRLGPLQRIDQDLLNDRVSSYNDAVMEGVDHLQSMGLGARALQDRLDAVIEQPPPTNLGRAITLADALVNQQALPVWLGMAPPQDQIHQAELLEQYCNNAAQEHDYLHDIQPMRAYAFTTLMTLLEARFPGQVLNPDHILIPTHAVLDLNVDNLTDFALRHWPNLAAQHIRPRSRTARPLPQALDANAVIQLVRQLDLKSAYQQLVRSHLEAQTDDARQRRRLFCRQLPWQALQLAHEQKLQERLSTQALSLVQQLFDMPDAVARASLSGATAMIRPLELIATEGASTAKVLGVYLISPQSPGDGPWVLYAPYSEQHVFKEYADETALLNELQTPGVLQDWVLMHLEDPHQATYRHLLKNSHPRPSDIRLAASPVAGNVLHYLFSENTVMLLKVLGSQFEEGAKTLWDHATRLFDTQIPTAVQFMAGKLAYPLVVWRSYSLFKRSAEALQLHQWKAALKDFVRGVAQMAALRSALDGTALAPPTEKERSLTELTDTSLPAATTLATWHITSPSRTRLQPFEAQDVALQDLRKNTLSQVYEDRKTSKYYVPLAGKVYSVKKAAQHWRLANDQQVGPFIGRNAQGIWVLELGGQEPRFGRAQSYLKTWRNEARDINIEAVGIRDIGALTYWKAQAITEALNFATYYTLNCRRNVAQFATQRDPNSRVGRFLGEMFGVVTLTPDQVLRVTKIIDEILDELTDPSLTGPNSMRFVVGTSRQDPASDYAFMIPADRERKLYLLSRFFDPNLDVYQNRLLENVAFNISTHARASTLIHELTHLKLDTVDIAYLDSMRPFPDLINIDRPGAEMLKTTLEDLRSTALSTMTPATMLFKTQDSLTALWEDFKPGSAIEKKIFKATGAKTLQDARIIFMSVPDKRIDTILANADSVTYLITHLGRQLEPGA